MKLQTTVSVTPEKNQINYDSKVLLLGSCFTENMGEKLEYFKFQNLQNPFGIVFNPVSTEILVRRALEGNDYSESDVFLQDSQWHCFEVHSLVTSENLEDYLTLLNYKLRELRTYLQGASHVILTFGSAWVYTFNKTGETVANCHKIPQKEFMKQLLTPAKVSEALQSIDSLIRRKNPHATIITTVSPVRHLKDGFVENARSKAHLLSGIHQVVDQRKVDYFPSFEIVMDELRDYRFYKEDMIHPSQLAIEIIWERFKEVWISAETQTLQKDIDVIQKGLQHRAFNPKSASHQKFQQSLKEKIAEVVKLLPWVSF